MNGVKKINGPVVIGGVGGSGTRVVAQMLTKLGYYLGNDLNGASDNLLYTLFFKRPKWFYKNRHNQKTITNGFNLFRKCMLNDGLPTIPELYFCVNALITMSLYGHNKFGVGKGLWPFTRLNNLLFPQNVFNENYIGWGWKEPNSFLFIDNFKTTFSHVKYIHTIRHGLDMAFSSNKQQLYNWGPIYGVQTPLSQGDEAKASLKYWVRANEQAIAIGEQLGKDRFFLLNYDELCISPSTVVKNLLHFLDIQVAEKRYQEAVCLPRIPDSMGRYKIQDLSQFDPCDLKSLTNMGFSIE